MKVRVFDIPPKKGLDLTFAGGEPFLREIVRQLTAGDPPSGLARAPEIGAAVRLEREGKRVELRGRAHVRYEPPCARCLKPVPTELDAAVEASYLPEPATAAPTTAEREIAADELDEFHYKDDVIDVAQAIADPLYLERPSRVLCAEDCKGLCPSCGADLNQSPCACKPVPGRLALAGLASVKLK